MRAHAARILAGALVISLALGIRQTFGLFVAPYADERAVAIGSLAFAIALQNLIWGLAQPLTGAATDRWGASGVIVIGAGLYASGLALAAFIPSASAAIFGMGVLVGLGTSCMTFAVVIPAVTRAVPQHARGAAVALATAGGSVGQALLVPFAQSLLLVGGVGLGLLALAALCLLATPLAPFLRTPRDVAPSMSARAGDDPLVMPSLRVMLSTALRDRSYGLLTLGFFTCGFQLAFITTHLPTYLRSCHLAPQYGALALSLIGLFNIAGTWMCGVLGERLQPQYVLAGVYTVRGAAIALFAALAPTPISVAAFAVIMGLTWLGTVPLTSATIGRLFGLTHLGTLFGVCFMSHQIGAFLGAWLGGVIFDHTGSYALMWMLTALAGFGAALVNLPVRSTPVAAVARA
jgi:MFS family permease